MEELYYDVLKRKDGVTRIMICVRKYGRYMVESHQEFEDTSIGNMLLQKAIESIKSIEGIEEIDDVNEMLEALDSR